MLEDFTWLGFGKNFIFLVKQHGKLVIFVVFEVVSEAEVSVIERRLRVTDNFLLDFCTFDVSLLQSAASDNVLLELGLG